MVWQDSNKCDQCGALVDVPVGKVPTLSIKAASGEANMRVISVDGKDVHICPMVRSKQLR